MKRYAIIPAILLIALVGCGDDEPEETTTTVPPPPTAQELSGQVINALNMSSPLPESGSEIAEIAAASWLGTVNTEKNKIAGEVNGAEAMRVVAQAISKRTRACADRELWSFVMVMVLAHDVFDPGSGKLDRFREKAFRELSKPVVTLKLLVTTQDGGHVAEVDMLLRSTGETFESVRFSPGDTVHGVTFVKALGRSNGIRIEYEDGGDQLDIMNER